MSRDRISTAFDVLGFAAISASGFVIALWLGLILVGGSLLILS